MSVKSLAPIALGIGALYLFSTKGSPFEQQPREPDAKPGGEHVGWPFGRGFSETSRNVTRNFSISGAAFLPANLMSFITLSASMQSSIAHCPLVGSNQVWRVLKEMKAVGGKKLKTA